jgi:hypothetical protein
MFNGYHNNIARHAAGVVIKQPDIPNATLGVDDAEVKKSLGKPFRPQPPNQIPKLYASKTADDVLDLGHGKQILANMFPQDFYVGEGW